MNVLIVEPFYSGSHKVWSDGYKKYSSHDVKIVALTGKFWKWRMQGGAISLAQNSIDLNWIPDLVIASDFLNLSIYISLTRQFFKNTKYVVCFHENQFAYPFSQQDTDRIHKRDEHYAFINYTSALVADRVFFNSQYNYNTFINGVKDLILKMPDENDLGPIEQIKNKSTVLPLGLDLQGFYSDRDKNLTPTILGTTVGSTIKTQKRF